MTREWAGVVAASRRRTRRRPPSSGSSAASPATVRGAARQRAVRAGSSSVDPELLLPYLLDRRGRTQDAILDAARAGDRATGQADGAVRAGDPVAARPRRCCSPPTASCSRPTRWSTTPATEADARRRAAPLVDGTSRRERRPAVTPHRRARRWPSAARPSVDLLVVGLGVTGAGVALDAATPRAVGGGRRRPRPRLRHLAVELQAGARRAALPRQRAGRRRPRERRRARHPDGRAPRRT